MCGLLAGIIAGVVKNAWNLIDYNFLHITQIRFLDWLMVLVTWNKPQNDFQAVIALLIVIIVWDGFLGALFAHLLVIISPEGIVFKSTIYSLLLWFSFKVIVNLYHVPFLSGMQPTPGAISNVLATILWGITMGLMLQKLNKPGKKAECMF